MIEISPTPLEISTPPPVLDTPDCVVVIPTYNEYETILQLAQQVLLYPRCRVLVVDDNSPDGTGALVAAHAASEPRLAVLQRPQKLGLGTAYLAGFAWALQQGAQLICEMDADFSHDPAYLPFLIEQAELCYDLVIGSRYVHGGRTSDWGVLRQLISRGGNTYANLILGLGVHDSTSGFRCYRREVLEQMDLHRIRSNGYAFQIEMVYRTRRAGFHIGEIPIIFPDRRVGRSKMSYSIVVEAMINVWRLRFGLI